MASEEAERTASWRRRQCGCCPKCLVHLATLAATRSKRQLWRAPPVNSQRTTRAEPTNATMPTTKTRASTIPAPNGARPSIETQADSALAWLKRHSTKATRDGMARYGVPSDNALGVTMADMKVLGKQLGKNHELAAALWATGVYEARMVTSFVDEPARVTPLQMDRWCRDFDNWGICDTICFHLFDRTPHAWVKVAKWHDRKEEFVKRAAFALLWGLTVHDKQAGDAPFLLGLTFIERAAEDERHFVKKAVNMALRAIGKRNGALNAAAVVVARRLADSSDAAPRWVGKDALRELASPSVTKRLAARRK
jgi:3-methyladenine DNA glycosylase AlkD